MMLQTSSKAWSAYLRWMLATLFATIAAVGVFNIFIDPLGVFCSPRISGLNALKPYLDHHREFSRWQAARRVCANTGIFGNSRAEIGFDPGNPIFDKHGLTVFNHSIPGSGANQAYQQIIWLRAVGCMPGTVLLGVDFFDFIGGQKTIPLAQLENTPAPEMNGRFLAETVFSISGLRDSIHTLALQHKRYPAILTERGFNPIYNYISEVEESGHYALFRQRAEENARTWIWKPQRLRPADGSPSEDEDALDAILKLAIDARSTVYVIIYPYHAEIRLMIERLGLAELFSEWKKIIVAIAQSQAEKGGRIEVWDFSGIAPETLEAIPLPGDRHTQLLNYWESGHFKKTLGDRIIARLFGNESGFGVRIDSHNIDRWLAEDGNRVQALLGTPSPLLIEVNDVLACCVKK